mmetsp:Transcript_29045/g.37445  ORF Transcript_29045/g.37445 Transcript_29045/m.37445 type:complete len:287 (-) Transcript_29045:85-945(-)
MFFNTFSIWLFTYSTVSATSAPLCSICSSSKNASGFISLINSPYILNNSSGSSSPSCAIILEMPDAQHSLLFTSVDKSCVFSGSSCASLIVLSESTPCRAVFIKPSVTSSTSSCFNALSFPIWRYSAAGAGTGSASGTRSSAPEPGSLICFSHTASSSSNPSTASSSVPIFLILTPGVGSGASTSSTDAGVLIVFSHAESYKSEFDAISFSVGSSSFPVWIGEVGGLSASDCVFLIRAKRSFVCGLEASNLIPGTSSSRGASSSSCITAVIVDEGASFWKASFNIA